MNLDELTLEELYKLKRELLNHVVGMAYNMQLVFQINEVINKWEQKKLEKELSLKE